MRASIVLALALAAPALAAYIPNLDPRQVTNEGLLGCDVSGVSINLPEAAAAGNVTVDPAQRIRFLTLGIGFQNYTCTNGVPANNQAIATLYDISCAVGTPIYSLLPGLALGIPATNNTPSNVEAFLQSAHIGDHYFQKLTPDAATANPVFDFRATGRGDFFAGARAGSIPDPSEPANNIPWLHLSNAAGAAATTGYRLLTAGGVAPENCTTEGELVQVPYAAIYPFLA